MAIEVSCSGCGRALQVGPEHAGKMARCPVCGHITAVPGARSPSSDSAAAEPALAAPAAARAVLPWYMRTPEGQEFGPASRVDLERWVSEGRVTADCELREGESGTWQNADEFFPALKPAAPVPVWTPPSPYAPGSGGGSPYADHPGGGYLPTVAAGGAYAPATSYQAPHRGALILILGLLGIFFSCFILSIMAWVMGSNDLREMEAGRMDRSGMDLTRAGMILGMIVSVLTILGILGVVGLMLLGAIAG